LLVYRNQLKRSELVLLTRVATLSQYRIYLSRHLHHSIKTFLPTFIIAQMAEMPINATIMNEKAELIFCTKVRWILCLHMSGLSFQNRRPVIFPGKIGERLWNRNRLLHKKEKEDLYQECVYINKLKEYFDDREFYNGWNTFSSSNASAESLRPSNILLPDEIFDTDPELDFSTSRIEEELMAPMKARAHKIEYFNMIFPVIKTKDNIIEFFNFGSDIIELWIQVARSFAPFQSVFIKRLKHLIP